MTGNDVRRELAALRVRIAELEATVQRLVSLVSSEAGARAMRQEERRERELDAVYASIRVLAAHLGPGSPETVARRIERIYSRELDAPPAAIEHIDRLRRHYGHGGPSRRTIRRALTELPNQCVNVAAAENEAITPPKHERTNDGRPIPNQARNHYS